MECIVTNNIVKVVCECGPSLYDRICQGVIAAFAVIGTLLALFKAYFDKRLTSPKLLVDFSSCQPYCEVVDDENEKGKKKLSLRVRIKNGGREIAHECKVVLGEVSLLAGSSREVLKRPSLMTRSLSLYGSKSEHVCHSLLSGDLQYFQLGYVAADITEKKVGESKQADSLTDAACFEFVSSDGTVQRLEAHQTHVLVPLTVCAENFDPEEYEVDLEWTGRTTQAFGSAGSIIASVRKVK